MSLKDILKLEDLGYEPYFDEVRSKPGLGGFPIARVTSVVKGAYRLKNEKGEYIGKITGRSLFEAASKEDYPAIGDWVWITELGNDQATIQGILPRKTIIKRRYGDKTKIRERKEIQVIATNIDVAFVVQSIDRDYSLNRFERYFSICSDGGVEPIILLNKIDLISVAELDQKIAELRERFPGLAIITTSINRDNGIEDLRARITKGKTYCFLGSSGVGKSSLINRLLEDSIIKTGDISSYSDRGKHTTTNRQMYFLKKGGVVIDNPGIREVGVADSNQGVDTFFSEIGALAQECKYMDCTHMHEPDCKIIAALKEGTLEKERYSNYLNLKKETAYSGINDLEKRAVDRQFGKFKKRAKKDFEELDI